MNARSRAAAIDQSPATGSTSHRWPAASSSRVDQFRWQRRRVGDDQPSVRVSRPQALDRGRRGQVGTAATALALGQRRHDDGDRRVGRDGAQQSVRALDRSVHHLGIEAQSITLLLHGLAATSDGVVRASRLSRDTELEMLRQWYSRCGTWTTRRPRARDQLGRSQDEVVILRSVEAGSESADLGDHDRVAAPTGGRCTSTSGTVRATSRASGSGPTRDRRPARGPRRCTRSRRRRSSRWSTPSARARSARVDRRDPSRATNSPLAIASASFDAATIPPFAAPMHHRMRGSRCVERVRATLRTSGRVEQSSTTHHSQSSKRLRLHAVDARQERAERRIVDRGDDRESGTDGRRC